MAKKPEVQFDWDEHNERHLNRHGVKAEEFEQAFFNDPEWRRKARNEVTPMGPQTTGGCWC
jgi:uncharacterized DUF497 family protein